MKKILRHDGSAGARSQETFGIREERGALREFGPIAFGGVMLVMAFAFAGHYMGQNAIAHNAMPGESLAPIIPPTSNIVAKGSLLPEGASFDIVDLTSSSHETVVEEGKSDFIEPQPTKPDLSKVVRIVPAAIDLRSDSVEKPAQKKPALSLSPPMSKIEQAFKLKRSERHKVIAQRRVQLAEENCLARAVYFEARSETELGQLAVAKVILNRVKDPDYPKSICGVVYQGSGSRNSCQFSFACDGLPDDVKSPTAWAHSKEVARKALAGDANVAAIGSATNYHADYVSPKWAKSMKRLIKIGRHIFYSDT